MLYPLVVLIYLNNVVPNIICIAFEFKNAKSVGTDDNNLLQTKIFRLWSLILNV